MRTRRISHPYRLGAVLAPLLIAIVVGAARADENLLLNGDLTEGSDNRPSHWSTDPSTALAADVVFSWVRAPGDENELRVDLPKLGRAEWTQAVELPPGWYRVSGETQTAAVSSFLEARVGIEVANHRYSGASPGTARPGGWNQSEFYFRVGKSDQAVAVICRLVGKGSARYRRLKLTKLSGPIPSGAPRVDLDMTAAKEAAAHLPWNVKPVGAGYAIRWRLAASVGLLLAAIITIRGMAGSRLVERQPRASLIATISSRLSGETFGFIVAGLGFFLLYALTSAPKTEYNEHVVLADALLHGHTWIARNREMEQAIFQGRAYIVHPPLSAFLLVPFVAVFGAALNQTAVCIAIGALSCALAWHLTRVLDSTSLRVWLTGFFGVGTTFWYEATLGNSWDFALVLSTVPTFLALIEILGEANPLAVGIFAGLAALARYDLALAWPFYFAILLIRHGWGALRVLVGFGLTAAVFLWFNEARFGSVFDIALSVYARKDPWLQGGGPFQLRFLPTNLYTLLFISPVLDDQFPYIHPQMGGQALILTSPAFLLALRPDFRKPVPLLLLLAAGFSMGPALLVYASGFMQFGTRYYVQVFPLLFALMVLGVKERGLDQMGKILIVFSVLLVAFGVWHIRSMGYAQQ